MEWDFEKKSLGLDFNQIVDEFFNKHIAIVKLSTVIDLVLSKNTPLDFLIKELDFTINKLANIEHLVNVVLIEKEEQAKIIYNKKIFECGFSYVIPYEYTTLKVFLEQYNINYVVDNYYNNGIFHIDPNDLAKVEDKKKRFYDYISELRKLEPYILKSDLEHLIKNITLENEDVFYIPYDHFIDGNKSEDYFEEKEWEKEYEEFQSSGFCDYAFELWRNDKEGARKKLEAKNTTRQFEPNKEVSGKAETAYLHIIQALKDELLKDKTRFKNQDELIAYLSSHYDGFTGLSETNLREKFAKANKIY